MRSAGSTRHTAASFSAPAAIQGRRVTVRQADQHLREFWQRSAAVAPVMEQSGDARKQGCRYQSQGRGGRRVRRERRMKEEAVADPAKRWQGRDGGREPGRCYGYG